MDHDIVNGVPRSLSESSLHCTSPSHAVPLRIIIFPEEHHSQLPRSWLQYHQMEMIIWAEARLQERKGDALWTGENLSAFKCPENSGDGNGISNDMINRAGSWFFSPKASADLRSWLRIPVCEVCWGTVLCGLFATLFSAVPHEILVSWPGMEPTLPASNVDSLNHWTTREVPFGLSILLTVQQTTSWAIILPLALGSSLPSKIDSAPSRHLVSISGMNEQGKHSKRRMQKYICLFIHLAVIYQ